MARKIGYFFFSFLPFLSLFILEFAASFFMSGVSALLYFLSGKGHSANALSTLSDYWGTSGFNTYIMIVYAILGIAVYGIWYYLQFYAVYLPKAKEKFHPLMLAGIVLLVPATQYLCTYLISLLSVIFPNWLTAYEELLETAGMDDSLTFGLLFYSVILAPICEELLCRGVILSSAKRALPFWAANLLQAFLFGLLHMNWLQGSYAFCLGLVLGYICEKGDSIYCSILLHILFNFWGTVLASFLSYENTAFSLVLWFVFGMGTLIAGVFCFRYGVRKRNRKMWLTSH